MRRSWKLLVIAAAFAAANTGLRVRAQPATESDTARYRQTDEAFDKAKQALDRALADAGFEAKPDGYRPTGAVRAACASFLTAQRAWLEARHRAQHFDPDLCARLYVEVPELEYQLRTRRRAFDDARGAAGSDRCAPAVRSTGADFCSYFAEHKDDRWAAVALTNTLGGETDLCARVRNDERACAEREGPAEPPPETGDAVPALRIVTPAEGDVFAPPPGQHETITVEVEVDDADGDLRAVEFRRDSDEGTHDETVAARPGERRYSFRTPLRAGVNTIEVVAIDRAGHRATASVNIIEDATPPAAVALHIGTRHDRRGEVVENIVAIPGRTALIVRATGADGKPAADGYLRLTVEGARFAKLDFQTDAERSAHLTGNARLDDDGAYTAAIVTTEPQRTVDYETIAAVPLTVTVTATLTDAATGKVVATASRALPLNLAILHGYTVGPDMTPRHEAELPRATIGTAKHPVQLDQERGADGEFLLLARPLHALSLLAGNAQWHLVWSDACRLPVQMGVEQPKAGARLDLGPIDVLTPTEHEQRFREIAKAFVETMGFADEAEETRVKKLVDEIEFRYGQSALGYTDSWGSSAGVISIHKTAVDYWATALRHDQVEAAPYFIIPHELGHFLHHSTVEHHPYSDVVYKFTTGANHHPWMKPFGGDNLAAPKDVMAITRRHTSFAESNADFFAIALRRHWELTNRAIMFSPYFKRVDYGSSFDDDERARQVVDAGIPGDEVEGVQTRFLLAVYGWHLISNPAGAYADYLAGMVRYQDLSRFFGWPPARTMQQWIRAKGMDARMLEGVDIPRVAARYGIRPEAAEAYAAYVTGWPAAERAPVVLLDGAHLAFAPASTHAIALPATIAVEEGRVVVDLSTDEAHRVVILGPGSSVEIRADRSIEVAQGSGKVIVDGKLTTVAAGATFTPTGTAYAVTWPAGEAARVWTLHGAVDIAAADGSHSALAVGESATITPGGGVASREAFDVQAARAEWIGDVPGPRFAPPVAEGGGYAMTVFWIVFGALLAAVLAFVVRSHRAQAA